MKGLSTGIGVAQELGLVLVVLGIAALPGVASQPVSMCGEEVNNIFRTDSLMPNVAAPMSRMAIMAIGVTEVIIAAGIDISTGSTSGCAAAGTVALLQMRPEQAAEALMRAQTTRSSIEAWAMAAGRALLTKNPQKWSPGAFNVAKVNALPTERASVESGQVRVLLAQNSCQRGCTSVGLILDKLLKNESPPEVRIIDPLTGVTKENVRGCYANREKWLCRS